MNYVELHIGDYEKGTAHLTACEDGIYGRLLRRYYDTEAPLPLDVKALQRLVRARTRDEKAAVQTVLEEFFQQQEDGWHHKRCDEEIAKYQEGEPEREAKRENAKERQRRARERRVALFDLLRSHGIVPAFDAPMSELQALASRVTERDVTPPVTRDATAIHTPDTSNQHQEQKTAPHARSTQDPPAGPVTSTEAGRACLLLREAGCARVNPSHVDLRAAIAEGVSPEAIRDTYLEHPDATNPFAWAIATARARHAEGAKPIATGPPRTGSRPQPLGKTAQALHALEAMKRGTELDQAGNPHGLPEASHARLGSHSGR